MNSQEKILDITWGTIWKLCIAAVLFYLIFLMKDIFIWVLFGVIISILFDPVIDHLRRFRIPRVVAVAGVYIGFFGLLGLVLYGMSPFFVNEIQRFSELLPQYLQATAPPLRGFSEEAYSAIQDSLVVLGENAQKVASHVLSGLLAVLGGIFSALFVLSIAVFLSLEERSVERAITFFFPKKYETLALNLWRRAQKRVSGWFVSRVLSSLFVAGMTFLTLFAFDVRYPFSLSLLAGILNFIPVVGPLTTGLFIGVVVAFDSFIQALLIVLAFTLIQQIENNIVTPMLSKRFVGLHPVLVLVALTAGAKLWGILGAILAVPLVGIFSEFLHDFMERKKKEEEAESA